jgi:hypothetical protein
MIELQALNKQANNPNAPEQSQAIGGLQRVSVSSDWGRYAASNLGGGTAESLSVGAQS